MANLVSRAVPPLTLRLFGIGTLACVLALAACQKTQSIMAQATPAQGQTHIIEAGGTDGDVGWWPQVVIDANERGHVAYCDANMGDVRYGVETPGGWALETVVSQGKTGKYISLALGPNEQVGLTYYDQSTHYFEYATRTATTQRWHTEHIGWGLEAGMASALRYDQSGSPHVLYYINSGKLIHASRGTDPHATWHKEELGDYQAVYSARIGALNARDGLWFSYINWQMDAATLYLGHLGASGWTHSVVPTRRGAGWRSQLAQVGQDLWVVHSDGLTENTALSFMTPDAQWHDVMLVRGGSSFAVGAYQNRGVVAYAQRTKRHRGLYLAREAKQGLWPTELIAQGLGNDPDVAMAISPQGRVIVVYYDVTLRGVRAYTTQL